MPKFWYIALDGSGTEQNGSINSGDQRSALKSLSSSGLHVAEISLTPLSRKAHWLTRDISFEGRGLSSGDLAELSRLMATLLESGIELSEALRLAQSITESRRLRTALDHLLDRVLSGAKLAQAMEERSSSYPTLLRTYVEIGEAANSLPYAFTNAAQYLEERQKTKSNLVSMLIYPAFLMTFSVIVVLLLVFFLAPNLTLAIEGAGGKVGGVLAVLSFTHNNIVQYPFVWGASIAAIVVAFIGAIITPAIRSAFMRSVPFLHKMRIDDDFARFSDAISAMMTAGSSLPEALGKTARMFSESAAANLLTEANINLENGVQASVAFESSQDVPAEFRGLFRLGEKSNQIPEMLMLAGRQLAERNRRKRDRFMQVISPLLTLVIGLGIGFLVYAMFSAIFEVNQIAF